MENTIYPIRLHRFGEGYAIVKIVKRKLIHMICANSQPSHGRLGLAVVCRFRGFSDKICFSSILRVATCLD